MTTKTYKIEIEPTQEIEVTVSEDGSGAITSTLKDPCPYCKNPDCYKNCAESQGDTAELENDIDTASRMAWNETVDVIEALVLAHACAGIDVSSEAYVTGIRTTFEALGNQL